MTYCTGSIVFSKKPIPLYLLAIAIFGAYKVEIARVAPPSRSHSWTGWEEYKALALFLECCSPQKAIKDRWTLRNVATYVNIYKI